MSYWENGIPDMSSVDEKKIATLIAQRIGPIASDVSIVTGVCQATHDGKPSCVFQTPNGPVDRVYAYVDITFLRRANSATCGEGQRLEFKTVGKFNTLQQETPDPNTNPRNASSHMSKGVVAPKPANGRPQLGFVVVACGAIFRRLEGMVVAAYDGNKPNLYATRCDRDNVATFITQYCDAIKINGKPMPVKPADELIATLEKEKPDLLDFMEKSFNKKRYAFPPQLLMIAAGSNGDKDIHTLVELADNDKQQLENLPSYFGGEFAVRCTFSRRPTFYDLNGNPLTDEHMRMLECIGPDMCVRSLAVMRYGGYDVPGKGTSLQLIGQMFIPIGVVPYDTGYGIHIEPLNPQPDAEEPPPKRMCVDQTRVE